MKKLFVFLIYSLILASFSAKAVEDPAIRLLHASFPSPPIDLYANESLLLQRISYTDLSAYQEIATGTYAVKLNHADQPDQQIITKNISFEPGKNYTLVLVRTMNGSGLEILKKPGQLQEGMGILSIFPLSPNLPPAALLIDDELTGETLTYLTRTDVLIPAGEHRLLIQADVGSFEINSLHISEGDFITLFLVGLVDCGCGTEFRPILVRENKKKVEEMPEEPDCDDCDYETYPILVNTEVNGLEMSPDEMNRLHIESQGKINITLRLQAKEQLDDVQVEAVLFGYEYGLIHDAIPIFAMQTGAKYIKHLQLSLPEDVDADTYKLRLLVADRAHPTVVRDFDLLLTRPRHQLTLKEIILDPKTAEPGRGMIIKARVENQGKKDEQSIKITASIPDIGLEGSTYIDDLEADKGKTSEEIFLRIPSCTKKGKYSIRVNLESQHTNQTKNATLFIRDDQKCSLIKPEERRKDAYTIPADQQAGQGETVVFPFIIHNRGPVPESYTFRVTGLDMWGSMRFYPSSLLVIDAFEQKPAYLYITPAPDAPLGSKVFVVSIASNNGQEEIPLTLTVTENNQSLEQHDTFIMDGSDHTLIILLVSAVVLVFFVTAMAKS